MGSLTTCVKKAGKALSAEDKNAILEAARVNRKAGMSAADAAKAAVTARLEEVQALLSAESGYLESAPDAAPKTLKERAEAMAAKGQPVHQDPGQAPEVATKAVVSEAVAKAASNRDRKPSEMRAELLRMVDEAIPNATHEKRTQVPRSVTSRDDPKHYVRFKVPGDGTFLVMNATDALIEFREKVEKSPGFRDRQPARLAPDRVAPSVRPAFTKGPPETRAFGVQSGSSGTEPAIRSMIDEGDPQAAVDYAAARGLDIAEVLKGDKVRLPKVAGLTPTAEAVGEFEPEAAPEPAAPAQPASASEATPPAPAPVSSREGQMNLASRASRIASLKAMNEQLRRVAPGDAWADANIEGASNAELDGLQDAISAALVAATRGPADVNPLRAELEGMPGAELRAIMERMNLAGARMVQEERIAALLAEDPAEVRAAMQAVAAPAPLQAAPRAAEPSTPPTLKQQADSMRRKPEGEKAAETPAMPPIGSIPRDVAQRAHAGTSHVPEVRAGQEQESFRAALADAWTRAMRAAGSDEAAQARVREVFDDVQAGYRARYMRTLEARSRVMSSMITGPARFPVERNRKRMETERKRAEEASEYLSRGIKRMLRAARGPIDNSPESELESVRLRLAEREEAQETMKAANVALRKGDDAALVDLGFTPEQIAELKKGDFAGRKGFPDYKLTNNNAEIRRLRERLAEAEKRLQAAADGPVESERPGVRMVEDAQDDRLRLFFDDKPSEEVRDALKAAAFKWSPNAGAWQRQLTERAKYDAKQVLDKHYPVDGPALPAMSRRMTLAQRAENLSAFGAGGTVIDREMAATRGFKTGERIVVEAYHGTARPDRVGTVFNPKRATSGPMAFFTSDPTLASSYAQGKEDTSIWQDYEGDYAEWFKVKVPGERSARRIDQAWLGLSPDERARIAALAPRVTSRENDDGNNDIVLGPEGITNGVGSYDYELSKTARNSYGGGNPLRALVESWLSSGWLFDEEIEFLKVLRLAGFPMDKVEYANPREKYPFVYKTFIRMGNPLVTSDVPPATMKALEDMAARDRSRAQIGGADSWDKNTITPREWVAKLKDPERSTYAWTSIPDKVTEVLRAQGYDGIVDWSGKGGGDIVAPVYIPFAPEQIKSALGNKGTYDPEKKDILMSRFLSSQGFVSPPALRAEVSRITANWDQDLADVKVVNRVEDLPPNILQAVRNVNSENTVRGLAMPDGRVFLVAENISTIEEGRFVLFHEVYGHVGMRAFLGDGYDLQMRTLRQANPALAKEADAWFKLYGEDEIAARIAAGFAPLKARQMVNALAVEEALADRAGDAPELKGWQRLLAALQRGLRRLGLGSVADMLEGMTEAETLDLLVNARRTVQRGQMERGLNISRMPAYQRVWHGTPYRGIEQFSTDKIGTGEGAQAYGWGLYFAGKREVADYYREVLRYKAFDILPEAEKRGMKLSVGSSGAIVRQTNAATPETTSETIARRVQYESAAARSVPLDKLTELVDAYRNTGRGQLYEVDIPEDSEMLLWDKPLSEQPQAIRDAVYGASEGKWVTGQSGERRFMEAPAAWMTGGAAYARVSRLLGGDMQASKALRAAGVRGIKYLDGTSRNAGDGTFNYVIFDGADAQIQGALFSRRTDAQARARELGLPATGTTESINRLVSIAESDPTTWTREDFDLIAPHLSVHQDFRDGAEDRIDSILAEGLRSGMVDGVQAMSTGRNWTYAKELAGKPAYVFISGGLKYQSADNPRLAPGNKPLFAITPEKGQGFYEALQTARVAPGAMPAFSRRTDQTQTPEFKRWFGDSKVVDADGKPLVVYHATDADFDRFAYTEDIGFHFGTAQAANARAEQAQLEDARVLPVYLRARKLLRMPDLATWDSQDVAGTLVDLKVITERQRYDGDAEIVDREQVREWLAAKGYDGIVYRNDTEGGGDSYIVFDPEQIKSAIGNRGTFDPTNADIRFSRRTSQDILNPGGGVQDFSRYGATKQDRIRGIVDKGREFYLGALTRDQIADVYGGDVPQVRDYDKLVRSMENERSSLAQRADDLYQRWAKMDASTNDKLGRIMLDATTEQVHPDSDDAPAGKTQIHANLRAQFKMLPAEAQAMYREVRDFHAGVLADIKTSLIGRIERQVAAGAERAALLSKVQQQFDQYLEGGPYFPLSRFGDYLVIATRPDGERVVAAYENAGEQEAAARALRADGFTTKMKTAKDYARSQDGSAGKFIGDVIQAVEKVDMVEATINGSRSDLKNQLLDDLNQLFIRSLPDLSYRKHFAHRKNTPGFSADVMRGFASSAFHAASYIARLNHADRMTMNLQSAYEAIDNAPSGDFNTQTQVLNELSKRHEAMLNPNTHPLSALATQVGFVMYLGLSPAAGLINMLQVPMVTIPYLGARYGFAKASAAMGKAYADIMKAPANRQSGFNAAQSLALSNQERQAISTLQDEGVIDLTQAHDLAAATDRDVGDLAKNKTAFAVARAMRIVGWTFHVPEVMNRQTTALMAYRLEREKGADHETALEGAREAIKRTQFDYSSSNRARYMQGNIARVVTQFKQFSQNMTYFLGRSAYQALKGETPEVRAIARRQILSTFATTGVMAGSLGLPGVGFVMGMVGALVSAMDGEDEPWDWQTEYRNLLADAAGKEMGEVFAKGVPRMLLPGWDIAGRVSLSDLWWRDGNREGQNPRESFATDMVGLLGPTASSLLGWYTAADHMSRGNYDKAVEAVVPKFIRDPLKAYREADQGVTSYTGDPLMDVNAWEVLGRTLGFAPSRVSEMYEGRNAVMNAKTALEERRQRLLNRVVKARLDGDTEAEAEVRSDITGFNQRNPDFRITNMTIARSLMNRRRNRDNTEQGILLPDTKADLRERARFANVE